MSIFDRFRTPQPATSPPHVTRQLEAIYPGGDDEPPPSGQKGWGYRAGPKDFRSYGSRTHLENVEKAWELYNVNPLAQRIIQIRLEHIINHDTRPIAKDHRVQEVLNRFWFDPINAMPKFATELTKDLLIFGTTVVPFSVNYTPLDGGHVGDGLVRLSYLDPSQISDITLDPTNVRLPVAVLVTDPKDVTATLIPPKILRIVHNVTAPGNKLANLLVGTVPTTAGAQDELGTPYAGACFLFRINHAINAKFGRSDLLLLEKWLEQSSIFFTDIVQHIYWLTNFVWDVQIDGATEAALTKRSNEIRSNPPARGSVLVHNEKEKWTAVTPDLRQEDISSASRTLIWWIAGIGSGIPEHWLGWGRETTRATAKEMQSPTLHMLEDRQDAVRAMLTEICTFQIHQAIIAKALPPDVDQSFSLTLPNLLPPDIPGLALALRQILTGLAAQAEQAYISQEAASALVSLIVNALTLEMTLNDIKPPEQSA